MDFSYCYADEGRYYESLLCFDIIFELIIFGFLLYECRCDFLGSSMEDFILTLFDLFRLLFDCYYSPDFVNVVYYKFYEL